MKSKVNKLLNRIKIIHIVLIILLILVGYYYGQSNGIFHGNSNISVPIPTNTTVDAGCTRTSRLENLPQYDRALSLIAQRLENWNKYSDEITKFKYFPVNLTNCIKVKEASLDNNMEGFFMLNSKDIKPDYYPITVDTSYILTDDALTALLLTHEITHVQQYIDFVNGETKLSCLDDEVSAFMAQLDFYTYLNNEENISIWLRMQQVDNLHPQIQILKNMTQINQNIPDSLCGERFSLEKADIKCGATYLSTKLKQSLSEDPLYKKQCGIK